MYIIFSKTNKHFENLILKITDSAFKRHAGIKKEKEKKKTVYHYGEKIHLMQLSL